MLRNQFFWLTALLFCVLSEASSSSVCAESGHSATKRQAANHPSSGLRTYAEPKLVGVSPFLPEARQKERYPLALNGFSAVDLRDHQQWVAGMEEHQAIFDGQLYRFADARQRAIFAAAPQRYAPVLGGDCIVTFAETGKRAAGDLRFGLQHGQRLFFFAGLEQRKRFRSDPASFVDADLANQGNCIVSKVDRQQLIKGMPKTVTTVGGLRYFFLGTQQQALFLSHLKHYGAEIGIASASRGSSTLQSMAPPNLLLPGSSTSQAKPLDRDLSAGNSGKSEKRTAGTTSNVPTDAKAVLAGYCPVSIRDHGIWVEGDNRFRVMYDGKVYQFAGKVEQALFAKDPTPYIPALAGNCVVSYSKSNRLVPGSIFHTAGYEGRLFLFAGAEERLAFKTDPAAYADLDLAREGNCVVTQKETGETVAGFPEYMTWYHGKRYYFVDQERKEKFLDAPESYLTLSKVEEKSL